MDPVLPLTGLFVGILVGLTGMGGGALMTPFLILVLGTQPLVAVGTDVFYGAVTKIAGAWMHLRQGTVDMTLVRRLALGSVPAGILAVVTLKFLPASGLDADETVRQALGGVLILVSLVMLARMTGLLTNVVPEAWRSALQERGTIAVGAIVGALVGFTSVGSGSLLVPFLIVVFPLNTGKVVGTDVFHAAILLTVTAIGHAQAGSVDFALAGSLLAGSIPGVAIGSWLALRVPTHGLRAGLAGLLLITGASLI